MFGTTTYIMNWKKIDWNILVLPDQCSRTFWAFSRYRYRDTINTKIKLEWAHKQFATRVHTLFYFLHDITNPKMTIKTRIFTHHTRVSPQNTVPEASVRVYPSNSVRSDHMPIIRSKQSIHQMRRFAHSRRRKFINTIFFIAIVSCTFRSF